MRYRPTTALARTSVLAAGTLVLALLARQPALVIIAAPFVCWTVYGVLRRPMRGEPGPEVGLTARRVRTGEAVELRVTAGPDRIVDVSLAPGQRFDLDPQWGAACDRDGAAVRIRPQRWGRLELPPAHVVVTDDAGLWQARTTQELPPVTVSPVAAVPGRGDVVPHPTGLAGLHASRRPGDGSSLADIRRFQPGDRLSRVNWRVTSRTGILHTNATTADRDTDVLVVMDTLADVTVAPDRGPAESSLDATVVAAASLVEHYLRLGDRVGVHDLGSMIGDIPPRAGIRQFAVFDTQLAHARADRPRGLYLRRVGRLRPGTFAVVCSPLLADDVFDEIGRLHHRGASVIVIDTLPASLGMLPPRRRRSLRTDHISFWDEAWALRRLEREEPIQKLRERGVPVTPWRGVEGIGMLAAELAANHARPRVSGRAETVR
ncbi:DUF58 domain-containing protein [Microbacterium invictum]|uniref:Uncharacterized protein (DUF58 family) n=1 Tax=Microbacterium invictum TaxID=515415 RepID=A0AA40SMT8_9MICO|nr:MULTISPECIES: DUF58 domain-containing protein [Microbacterium]MBB4139088.1 uncharacterized protein (DUF58 family) [Microbacterium invictum]